MKNLRLSLSTAMLGALLFSPLAHAAAFQFYELGTPINGTAGVGQASVSRDASTSYFNPAGMLQLPDSQFMLGTQTMLSYVNFSPNTSNTVTGNNGSNAGGMLPGASAFFVYNASPRLKVGASLTTPYGGALNYDNHWVGRYNVQQMLLYTLNLNPAIAYQVNDWASLGAGISIEYANLYQTVALPIAPGEDGQLTIKADNTSPGFNLGMLLTPTPATKVGVAYRSQIIHNLRGNLSFMNVGVTPSASTKLVMPSNIIASISQKVTCKFTVLGELGWSDWSSMQNTVITINEASASTPQHWHDTYRVGLGGTYQFTSAFLFQAGASYDSSPTSSSLREPSLPADKQVRLGLGALYDISKAINLGLSYEFIKLGSAPINNTTSNGTLAGSYERNNISVVQASLNVHC